MNRGLPGAVPRRHSSKPGVGESSVDRARILAFPPGVGESSVDRARILAFPGREVG
jgi:hypothetical protein